MPDQTDRETAAPAPNVSTDVSASVQDIAAMAAGRAVEAEVERRVHPEVMEALLSGGFARHFVPKECGGTAGTFAELTRAVAEIGKACAATAWCASLAANLSRMAAYLPAEGYREIWAEGPDPLVVGTLMPLGKVTSVKGGWRISGQWPYISGIDFADWVLLCGVVLGESDDAPPEARILAVPRSDVSLIDTWLNVGMKATGSHTVTAEDVFVPAARGFRREDLFDGQAVDSTARCHSVPLQAVNGLSFATPVLGAARGAFGSWSGYIAEKLRAAGPTPGPGLSRATYDQVLARCSGEIDAAHMLLERASDVADRGAAVTEEETVRNLRDCALSVEQLVTAVNRLFHAAGTNGQSVANPLQRHWRDVNSAATHVALQFEPAARAYVDQLLAV